MDETFPLSVVRIEFGASFGNITEHYSMLPPGGFCKIRNSGTSGTGPSGITR
jgi:hypothetical protein